MSLSDLQRERQLIAAGSTSHASDVASLLRLFLDGGVENSRRRDAAYAIVSRDPFLSYMLSPGGHPHDLERKEARVKTMQQIRRIVEISQTMTDRQLFSAILDVMIELSDSFSMRLGVHAILFKTALVFFATEVQQAKWLTAAENFELFGSFSMTELGHSSALQGIETTATLDVANDEWILHSPTLTSAKWWIGMVGQTATHTALLAQTILPDGESLGLNWFIVPLRDPLTGRLRPGVTCGDIGAKAGRNGLDNGWILLSHVRIPRENMLMRFCKVGKGGKDIEGPVHPAVMYAPLIPERLTLTFAVRTTIGKALTIAIRYGITRRTGGVQRADPRLPSAAVQPASAPGRACGDPAGRAGDAGAVVRVRDDGAGGSGRVRRRTCQTCTRRAPGSRPPVTWWGSEVLENCRRACGGHAYSSYNAIAGMIADWGVMTTGGGDNFPMAQQCARYILYSLQSLSREGQCRGTASYLNNAASLAAQTKCRFDPSDEAAFSKLDTYAEILSVMVVKVATRLTKNTALSKKNGGDPINDNMVDLTHLSNLHSYVHLLNNFLASLQPPHAQPPASLLPTLHALAVLYFADVVRRIVSVTALEEWYFDGRHIEAVKHAVRRGCADVRAVAAGVTDALGFPDFVLNSPIGRHDGHIYEAYFETVKGSPDGIGIPPYFESEIRPILESRSRL
ncbi:hypothetical protein DFJ73DRAFT_520830 [Zopfochytrium polystomum]|nr:hypothetical protein DFJ73DRAFT_520830 [Zopfochytrium polystomum]